jgi:hypothetical protein
MSPIIVKAQAVEACLESIRRDRAAALATLVAESMEPRPYQHAKAWRLADLILVAAALSFAVAVFLGVA